MTLAAHKIAQRESNVSKDYRLFQRLFRTIGVLRLQRHLSAETMVGTILAIWCKSSFPNLPSSKLRKSKVLMRNKQVQAFAQMLAQQSFLEATYWLSSTYALLCSDKHRESLAMYFTPPSLTTRLIEDLKDNGAKFDSQIFCDPACGGAAFLAPLALKISQALKDRGASPKRVLNHIKTHLLGIDADPTLCALSRHFLLMTLYAEVIVTRHVPRFSIRCGNSLSLTNSILGRVDVVVCNPPYRKLKAHEVHRYKNAFPEVTRLQPNLYSLFMCLCVKLLRVGGTAALVTPTSYLSGQYFSELRTFMMNNVDILSLGTLSDRNRVFINVQQETALTIIRRRKQYSLPQIRASISLVSKDGTYKKVGKCVLLNSGSAWPVPRCKGDIELLKCATKSKYRLQDYGYRVRIGAFVWNRDKRETYSSLGQVWDAQANNIFPLIWSSDIGRDGSLRFTGRQKKNGEARFVELANDERNIVIQNQSVVLQRVTSKEQPKRLVAAVVPRKLLTRFDGYIGENHTVILEQEVRSPKLTPRQLANLLGTPVIDRYFRCISGSTNVSAFELSQLVLPDPTELKRYLDKGHSMAEAAKRALLGVQ